ncbi:type III-A CRISPR-associated RAMP protein Csm5 [Methylosarcina fibrata]|uniref:type III-A CRISPR-associated RAMP protein Csm5 n=1 Tax=Methylosarcina fibrata TaxID=105972 RepID=UPI0003771308|nr:type III-A CRISPR-associated RAMP protein Csm5 [Methylosarcina fibrata]
MKGINQSVRLGLEILTPTQAGSGAELFKELDYIDRGGMAFVVDQQASFNAVASGNLALDADAKLLSGAHLSDLVNAAGQDFGYRLPWLATAQKVPDKFREHLKDTMNRPYLPGSAIKGAIRTALIAEWLRSVRETPSLSLQIQELLPKRDRKGNAPRAKAADDRLLAALLGNDAKQDIFRVFKVKDTLFADTDLRLADIRWLNEKRWRSMSKRNSLDNWQQADGIYAEVLQSGALGLVTLQWDGFLLSDISSWQQNGAVSSIAPKDFGDLKQRLNQHAKYRLQKEIQFYKDQGKSAPEQECHRLLKMIETDQQAAYLQMSWGSGWRGMTGDWASQELVEKFRELYPKDMGRPGKIFPKTRRLVVSGEPKFPLGWVRLLSYDLVADKLEKQQIDQQAVASQSAWVNQKLAQIAQQNRSSKKEALRGKALAQAWQEMPDGEEKQAALSDIKRRWQNENWWDEPNGKAAKQAKTIYEQS